MDPVFHAKIIAPTPEPDLRHQQQQLCSFYIVECDSTTERGFVAKNIMNATEERHKVGTYGWWHVSAAHHTILTSKWENFIALRSKWNPDQRKNLIKCKLFYPRTDRPTTCEPQVLSKWFIRKSAVGSISETADIQWWFTNGCEIQYAESLSAFKLCCCSDAFVCK